MAGEYYSDFTQESYLRSNFLDLILKRVKKDLKNNNPLDISKDYVLYDRGIQTKIAAKILGLVFGERLTLAIIPMGEKMLSDAILLNDLYLEEYVSKKLGVFFENKELDDLKKNSISILRTITYNEMKNLKDIFSIEDGFERTSLEFVENLHKQYSQTKTSFLKSFNFIEQLFDSE